MSSTTTKRYNLLEKTVQVDFPATSRATTILDFPVTLNGKKKHHEWVFDWQSSRQRWSSTELAVSNGMQTGRFIYRYSYNFRLSGMSLIDFEYDEAFYEIKIMCKDIDGSPVLAKATGDLTGDGSSQFNFAKEVTFSPHEINTAVVQITLQSYVNEIPPRVLIEKVLSFGISADIVIKTKGQDFNCHQIMLASASEYFDKMFNVDMKEKKESVVDWVGVFEADVVQDLLHYVYAGQAPPNLVNTSSVLMEVANMCLMDGLKTMCSRQLRKALTVDNMGDILRVAAKYECQELQEVVVDFIVRNYDSNGDAPPPWDKLEPEFGKSLAITLLKFMVTKKISPKSE